jgi:hypothetical protein
MCSGMSSSAASDSERHGDQDHQVGEHTVVGKFAFDVFGRLNRVQYLDIIASHVKITECEVLYIGQ